MELIRERIQRQSRRQSAWRPAVIFACALTISATLSACGSMAGQQIPASEPSTLSTQLPPQKLDTGECGLFVWSADNARRFILFSAADTGRALWHDGEAVQALSFGGSSGTPIYEQYPAQDYNVQATGQYLSLKLSDPEEVETAMRFKSGRLTVGAESEWDRVIPVVGLASCQE